MVKLLSLTWFQNKKKWGDQGTILHSVKMSEWWNVLILINMKGKTKALAHKKDENLKTWIGHD